MIIIDHDGNLSVENILITTIEVTIPTVGFTTVFLHITLTKGVISTFHWLHAS
ncbi:hypothetical protein Xmau_03021 [Xenorhabdus mauleonii]|uniref:Uncharacterized protein n=1 Tax=Xenorhabdus mauleonii TaxID=351675 RepID=A0A1I3SAT1_9GAMM|nr:hypothetical protein Xmau_03021 [Xenorhabdus mauleonii]SFJ55805.1 hypothetical protein SAMN05421680_11142 [Xenorhabdus mauleonii]